MKKTTVKGLVRVPIEYIENAIKWLKEHGYQKIGILSRVRSTWE